MQEIRTAEDAAKAAQAAVVELRAAAVRKEHLHSQVTAFDFHAWLKPAIA